jgi:hypothetical protein
MGMKMLGLWGNKSEGLAVSAEFQHTLMQQVMRTELIRVKALIGTTAILVALLLIIHTVDPYAVEHLWYGRLKPEDLYSILIPFILFEIWVHVSISRYLRLYRDLPVYRRYLGTLIETSMPTLALAMEIDSMGPAEALGSGAAGLFHFHYSLDAAAGFLALDLHGLRRGRRTVLHGDVLSSCRQHRSCARSLLSLRAQRDDPDLRHEALRRARPDAAVPSRRQRIVGRPGDRQCHGRRSGAARRARFDTGRRAQVGYRAGRRHGAAEPAQDARPQAGRHGRLDPCRRRLRKDDEGWY